jgi:hypothetical protein
MISRQNISDFLRHPFVILVATAIISGLLIPFITQEWHEQSRKADVKASLITDAGKAVANILTASKFSEFAGKRRNKAELERIFLEWEIEHSAVSSKIRAYLLDPTLAKDWERFSHMLRFAYASGVDNPQRIEYLTNIRAYLNTGNVDWGTLEKGYSNRAQFYEYKQAWLQMKEALLERYREIAQRILDAKAR